jgi:drug/metabolite transporter (DMT)-like permease
MLTGAGLLLALSVATGETRVLPEQPMTWLAVGYLVVFGSVVMFALYLFALQRWTASAVSYTTLLLPLVTVSAGVVFAGERVSPLLVVGGAVVLAGVYVGAFLKIRPARSSASSLPECLPVDAEGSAGSVTSAPVRGSATG